VINRKSFIIFDGCLLAGELAYLAILGWQVYQDMKRDYR